MMSGKSRTPIGDIVRKCSLDLGRSEADAERVIAALNDQWIVSLEDWKAVAASSSHVSVTGVPAMVKVYLDNYSPEDDEKNHGKEEKANIKDEAIEAVLNEEDAEQMRIVRQFADWHAKEEDKWFIVKVFVNKLSDLDSSSSTMGFDVGVQMWYRQVEMINAPEGAPDMEKVFKPRLEWCDSVEVEELVEVEDGGSFYIREEYRPYGVVNWYQRYRGRLHIPLDLRAFPFDVQHIVLRFGCTLWSADNIHLINQTDASVVDRFNRNATQSLLEWEVLRPIRIRDELIFNEEDRRDISYVTLDLVARRHSTYYIVNVFTAVFFLDVLFWFVFLVSPLQLNDRLSIIITCFLALVAFNFVVAESIPKVSHSTYLTFYFLLNYCLFALGSAECATSYMLYTFLAQNTTSVLTNNTPDGGPYIAQILDWTMLGVVALIQTGVFLFYIYMSVHGHMLKTHPNAHILTQQQPPVQQKQPQDQELTDL